jgi:hypothetical protein
MFQLGRSQTRAHYAGIKQAQQILTSKTRFFYIRTFLKTLSESFSVQPPPAIPLAGGPE